MGKKKIARLASVQLLGCRWDLLGYVALLYSTLWLTKRARTRKRT
jgi:hypothetical protein